MVTSESVSLCCETSESDAVNEIINFQLEGVPKTSCQPLLALSAVSGDRQQPW